MEDINKAQNKLPNQELDYFKIAKILLSRWYWVVGSVILATLVANVYLWYTPKVYATSATMKFEEKKSEISDLMNVMGSTEKGASKIQSETYVIQSRSLVLSAIKDLDYRVSFFLGGRVRTTDIYPQKPLNIQLLKFDTLNFYHDLIGYQPNDNHTFSLTYKAGGKDVTKVYSYNTPINIENMAFSIKYPGGIRNAVYLFKFNVPDDFVGRVLGGLHTNEVVKNSNIISLQETDSNPQFAADVLNAIMKEYLEYDRNQKHNRLPK
jgi:tyrosine-protein kinase Etk/Wzc